MDKWQAILSLVGALVIFILILFLTYLCTRYITKRYAAAGFSGRYIEVLERLPLAADRALLIVRVAEQVLLVGATAQHIEVLMQLNASYFPNTVENPEASLDFSAILKKTLKSGWGIGAKSKDEKDKTDG